MAPLLLAGPTRVREWAWTLSEPPLQRDGHRCSGGIAQLAATIRRVDSITVNWETAMTNSEALRVRVEDAQAFATRLLVAHGVPKDDAATVAGCLVRADLRGVGTHGLVRLPGYLDRLDRGLINASPSLPVDHRTASTAIVDGENGFGFVVATRAMAEAIDLADHAGIAMVAVRRSTHFGMASSYVLQGVEAGFISMVFTNASRAMPPWGGREALFGTSPIALGTPTGKYGPVVLDMSPAVAARGKIRLAAIRGEDIPLGYALDSAGRATTDPVAALEGVVLPIGGPKGSGLSMFMDIFGGVLTGAAFAGGVGDQYKDFDNPQNVGHVFFAIRPDLFMTRAEYLARMDTLVEQIKASPPAEGFTEVLLPGELESRSEALARREGITYVAGDLEPLAKEATRVGVAALVGTPTTAST